MFIEVKDDGGGGDNWTTGAISRAKLQSNDHQQTNIQFFYRPDAWISSRSSEERLQIAGAFCYRLDSLPVTQLPVSVETENFRCIFSVISCMVNRLVCIARIKRILWFLHFLGFCLVADMSMVITELGSVPQRFSEENP